MNIAEYGPDTDVSGLLHDWGYVIISLNCMKGI